MSVGLSSKTLMLTAGLAVLAPRLLGGYAPEVQPNVDFDFNASERPTIKISQTNLDNLKEYIFAQMGEYSVDEALASIIQDSRGLCGGGGRCALFAANSIAVSDFGDEYAAKLAELGLDPALIDSFVISKPSLADRARLMAIVETDQGDKIVEIFESYKADLVEKFQGLDKAGEVAIASNAQVGLVGNYAYIAMSPHGAQSANVIEQGLGLLTQFGLRTAK
jgi:hypothetical protein